MNILTRAKPKTTISAEEVERRKKALRNAYAHNRIEGLSVTPESDVVFQSFVRGEIELNEIRPRLKAIHNRP